MEKGKMEKEKWNNGKLTVAFHYSTIPLFLYSIVPVFHFLTNYVFQ
jgi:hypothetical protein